MRAGGSAATVRGTRDACRRACVAARALAIARCRLARCPHCRHRSRPSVHACACTQCHALTAFCVMVSDETAGVALLSVANDTIDVLQRDVLDSHEAIQLYQVSEGAK